ncbi:MAG TPA: AcvB/VirJ family lysyl-phosphatidylglycerol hydrolase [Balneolales bacterium]|nr:AcvB/VirJ family lysyl-phosphatidylglycerol hydrolase [Balneolales bacterium]
MIKKLLITLHLFFFTLITISAFAQNNPHTITFGRFGKVYLYQKGTNPEHVVLFISGDGGWNKGVIDMARDLAAKNSLVIGIDIPRYLHSLNHSKEKCLYPAADFESLSQYVQKKLQLSTYHIPVLVGYSSGATLVYAILSQTPPNTFKGGISLGFSPDIAVNKPFCRGTGLKQKKDKNNGEYDLLPSNKVHLPWTVIQGEIDKVCSPKAAQKFVQQASDASLVPLPGVGHGFSIPEHWKPEFISAYEKILQKNEVILTPKISSLKDLPIEEVPATNSNNDLLAVILSGDGGWASIDQGLSKTLSSAGISTVGLNSLRYFWKRRTPEGASADLERIIRYYLAKWHKQKILLIGYSLGADVLPFMVRRLPSDLKKRTELITFLSPSATVDFQFHLSYWLGGGNRKTDLHVLPEIQKLQGIPLLCFYGDDEKDSICKQMSPDLAKVIALTGGHHYDGNYQQIAEYIMKDIHYDHP